MPPDECPSKVQSVPSSGATSGDNAQTHPGCGPTAPPPAAASYDDEPMGGDPACWLHLFEDDEEEDQRA